MRRDPKPADAWWDPEQSEWVHGDRDAEGRLVGEVRYWNADGQLISTAEHVAGKPHGIARRYYANGELWQACRYTDGVIAGERRYSRPSDPTLDTQPPLGGAHQSIATCIFTYEAGDLVGMQYFDAAGRELSEHGRAMPPRPAGIPPTAFHIAHQGWFWTRRRGELGTDRIEAREYFETGALRVESDERTGSERGYYASGALRYEGRRRHVGGRYPMTGIWRYYDPAGGLRLEAEHADSSHDHHRRWHRPPAEAAGGGVSREGPVSRGLEHGVWLVRDEHGAVVAEWDLGPPMTGTELLGCGAASEVLDVAYHHPSTDRSLPAVLARVRRAGATGELVDLALDESPPWRRLDDDGALVSLVHPRRRDLAALLAALRWGPVEAALLADIANELFRAQRVAAALDVIEAARLLSTDPSLTVARGAYLRALGRHREAELVLAGPDRLDARALSLLAEIRDHPDDDGTRLVFADHSATVFPEHAAMIVAQCHDRRDEALVRAFLATLPAWLREHRDRPIRGFFEDLRALEAEHITRCDLDLLYRIAPACTTLELIDARGHVPALVTLPGMRRYRALSLLDTYLDTGELELLATCPYLDQLAYLGLARTGLDDGDLATLARATGLSKLTGLDLSYGREDMSYTLVGVRALVHAPFARQLESIAFAGCWLGDGLAEVISQFPSLIEVDLSRNALTDAGARALVDLLRADVSLRVDGNDFTAVGRAALVERFGKRVRLE